MYPELGGGSGIMIDGLSGGSGLGNYDGNYDGLANNAYAGWGTCGCTRGLLRQGMLGKWWHAKICSCIQGNQHMTKPYVDEYNKTVLDTNMHYVACETCADTGWMRVYVNDYYKWTHHPCLCPAGVKIVGQIYKNPYVIYTTYVSDNTNTQYNDYIKSQDFNINQAQQQAELQQIINKINGNTKAEQPKIIEIQVEIEPKGRKFKEII